MPIIRITEYKPKTGLDKHSPRLKTLILELEFTGSEDGGNHLSFAQRAKHWIAAFESSLAFSLRKMGVRKKDILFHEEGD